MSSDPNQGMAPDARWTLPRAEPTIEGWAVDTIRRCMERGEDPIQGLIHGMRQITSRLTSNVHPHSKCALPLQEATELLTQAMSGRGRDLGQEPGPVFACKR